MKPLRLIFNTAVLYAATIVLGMAVAWRHIMHPTVTTFITPTAMGWSDVIFFAIAMAVFTFFMLRFIRATQTALGFLMAIALVGGSQFAFAAWLSWPGSLIAAIALLIFVVMVPRVIVHDVAVGIGLAGIAAVLGLSLDPLVVCALLTILSIYDIISVYRTKHMVRMAGSMLASGVVLGFLVPARLATFWHTRRQALNERSVMLLGSGDIGLPMMLVTATVSQSVQAAGVVAIGAVLGLLLMQTIFVRQRVPAPMAALPPIAALSVIGYLVAVLIGV